MSESAEALNTPDHPAPEAGAQPDAQPDAKPDAQQQSAAKPSGTSASSPRSLRIEGKAKLEASVSMLYTDILSQELSATLGGPDAVEMIQKHFQYQRLENLRQQDIPNLLNQVPESFFEVIKEASFATGALSKEVVCTREIKVGEPFAIQKTGIMAQITMKDARVQAITAQPYTAHYES